MYTFQSISEIGRARRLYKLKTHTGDEELLISTTGEFVLRKGNEEKLLPNSQNALDWSINHGLCLSRHQFLRDWVDLIRIPYGSVIPKVRIYSEGMDILDYGISHILRAQELIQHPIFNHCIVKQANHEHVVTLTPAQRATVVRTVRKIYETDYYSGTKVSFTDGSHIQYAGDDSYLEKFNLFDGYQIWSAESFSVYQGADLPFDFRTRTCDETNWVRVPETYEIWNDDFITKLASVAITVCIHYQINDAMIDGFDEHPLALHGLGCTELRQG